MKISALTSTQVWAASARSLTNFGSGALTTAQTPSTVIAGAASVDLRPSAGIFSITMVAAQTGAAATGAIQVHQWDGTNNIPVAATAAAPTSNIGWFGFSGNSDGLRLLNTDATHGGSYQVASLLFTQ